MPAYWQLKMPYLILGVMSEAAEYYSYHNYAWQDEAACVGSLDKAFFAPDGIAESEEQRRVRETYVIGRYCVRCSVRTECLNYALKHHIDIGVWGGKGQDELKELTSQR